jgi:hypothetical protein
MKNRSCRSRLGMGGNRVTALLFVFVLACFTYSASAQSPNPRVNSYNVNSWFQYFGNHKISPRWGFHTEIQVRRSEFVTSWQQLLLRAGVDYYPHDQVRITAGYCFVNTWPYGDFPVANNFPEHRIWQNFLFTHPVSRITMQHRFRPEQRFFGNPQTGKFENTRYENRLRYMVRVVMPLKEKTLDPKEFYLAFQNEIFINFGKEVRYNIFDQNRLYGALGYHMGKPGRIELGFMNQIVQQRNLLQPGNEVIIENNNTIVIAYFQTLQLFNP